MAKFNTKSVGKKTENLAGGEAFAESKELELVSLLLTSFVADKFYESKGQNLKRLGDLVSELKDKKFAGQAAVYARTEFGMRSITHALTGELFRKNDKGQNPVSGLDWVKKFINKVVFRPDDALEIMSYYLGKVMDKSIPAQLKKGLADALAKFDSYQLSKYRGEGKDVKLVDLFNLMHPKPTKEQKEAFQKLIEGNLKSTETWEAKMTEAGKVEAETDEEKDAKVAENKKEVWETLLKNNKLGYFALLRNLRNILEQAPEMVDLIAEKLVDPKAIKKSLILPFQFKRAYDAVKQTSFKGSRKVLGALDTAVDLSVNNCPQFDGKTLVVLDISGSMSGQPEEIGRLFMAVLAKRNPECDTMVFSDDAKYFSLNPKSLITDLVDQIPGDGGGTNFHAIFQTANKAYDRIVILSDMQGWVGYDAPTKTYHSYCKKFDYKSKIYSFDLNGYGTLQFPEEGVYCIAGFSDKTLELMKLLETDRRALVNKIRQVEF